MNVYEEITISAPGKIILFGEHSVVFGTLAVAGSLNMRTTVMMKRCPQPELVVKFPVLKFAKNWKMKELEETFKTWPNDIAKEPQSLPDEYGATVKKFVESNPSENDLAQLAQIVFLTLYLSITKTNNEYPCLEIDVRTDLPVGSGLGSSASLSTCLAAAFLYHVGTLSISKQCRTRELNADDLNLVSQWAFVAEKIVHGKPSGIDNSVCTFGGLLGFQKGELKRISGDIGLKVLLVNTKVPRNTKRLVSNVQQLHKEFSEIVSPILDAIGSVAETAHSILTKLSAGEETAEEHYTILEKLISMNHPLLASLGVSHPLLNRIRELAAECGLHAKLTGAGGGGCAYVLIPPYADPKIVIRLREELEKSDYQCWETRIGSAGLKVDDIVANETS